MTDLAFHPTYVDPYYLKLMNLNFLKNSDAEVSSLFDSLRQLGLELSDEMLVKMLNESWRPAKVAAWVIGLSNRKKLASEIRNGLQKPGTQYCEHLLINLLILDPLKCKEPIQSFLYQQFKYFIDTKNILIIDCLSIDWALSILSYLEKRADTLFLDEMYKSDLWLEFERELKKIKFYEGLKARFEPAYREDQMLSLMNKLNHTSI